VARRIFVAVISGAASCALLAAGCDKPPGLELPPVRTPTPAPPTPTPTPPSVPTAPPTLPPTTTAAPSPTGFAEATAVNCGGSPGSREVLAILRRAGLVTSSSGARVVTGPMCAGTWQWTVVRMPDADPLQVVTRGAPGSLRLVTAGTDVCSIPVRTGAPAGIRAAACDARPPAL
jgi:hypothetical protein